jgi:hypothetical protein
MPWKITPRLLKTEPMRRCLLGECKAACCLYGVWVDTAEVEKIIGNAHLISPCMEAGRQDPQCWFDDQLDTDEFTPTQKVIHSTVLKAPNHYGGTECVFLRTDHKCALQVAADLHGLHSWHFKPFYCILHPLDLDEKGRITLDETGLLLDEEGSCLRPSEKEIPLLETFEPELRYFLGDQEYQGLLDKHS